MFVGPGALPAEGRRVVAGDLIFEKGESRFETDGVVAQAVPEGDDIIEAGRLRIAVVSVVGPRPPEEADDDLLHDRGVDEIFD